VTISGQGNPPPFIEALLSATADLVNHIAEEETEDLVCKKCGTKWSEVSESGLLGCPECWGAFVKKLGPRLQAEQRKVAHTGKSPSGASHDRRFLEHQLQDAIRREDYKTAAKLRDKLIDLDSKGEDVRR
jgi:protein arginine kinase activator